MLQMKSKLSVFTVKPSSGPPLQETVLFTRLGTCAAIAYFLPALSLASSTVY